jgi:hypothetical protein
MLRRGPAARRVDRVIDDPVLAAVREETKVVWPGPNARPPGRFENTACGDLTHDARSRMSPRFGAARRRLK